MNEHTIVIAGVYDHRTVAEVDFEVIKVLRLVRDIGPFEAAIVAAHSELDAWLEQLEHAVPHGRVTEIRALLREGDVALVVIGSAPDAGAIREAMTGSRQRTGD